MNAVSALTLQAAVAIRLAMDEAETAYIAEIRRARDAGQLSLLEFWTERLTNLRVATREAFEPAVSNVPSWYSL